MVCRMRACMNLGVRILFMGASIATGASLLSAQSALTWEQVKTRFESANPSLKAALATIAESRAGEITAHLRPNPDFSMSADGFQVNPYRGIYRPLGGVVITPG